jgi:hypothetical protein
MSQHINLIVAQGRALPRSVTRSLLALAVIALVMLGYWQAVHLQTSGLRDVATQTQSQLVVGKEPARDDEKADRSPLRPRCHRRRDREN